MSTLHGTTRPHTHRKAPVAGSLGASEAEARVALEPTPRSAHEPVLDPEALRLMIAESAYYRAEQRGFAAGGELQDWLDAEAQIRARLSR